jgi:hypothetical protein
VDEPVIGHLLRSWVTIDPVDLVGPQPYARLGGGRFSIPDGVIVGSTLHLASSPSHAGAERGRSYPLPDRSGEAG